MKTIICSIFCVLIISCASYNQVSNQPGVQKLPETHVKDWGKMKMVITKEIWSNAEAEIISQIGSIEFEEVKKMYNYRNFPPALSVVAPENFKDRKKFYERLSSLRVYKIASFTHVFEGKDWGKLAIIKAPYKDNESWNKNVKWETVYFIVPEVVTEP